MLELACKLILGYLAGSIVGSLVVGRLRGVDIRLLGSGNAGGTNALRTQGKGFALAVVLIDVLKAVLPILWLTGAALPGVPVDAAVSREAVAVVIGAGAVAGHVWPVFFGFRGGKGMATLVGAYAAIEAALLAPVLAGWVLVAVIGGYVGIATMSAAAVAPLWLAVTGQAGRPLFWFALLMAVFVAWTHRSNIARLRARTEHRMFRGLLGRRR
ncbi:glycerol-3-phosphate acyltransferase [Thioalkalivibrio sp. XN279]|uniref:glycerol-3-phosphate acyltransferase n=1 Tax=Thioalkalivibrio sp. XN279 TaxID=2714953 RepID=UPI00140CF291|nr:glycerol-3-phosphate acyltransferase [Thioalkalivibrio sp. XN279]NHA14256.1 glycerol-3-phosphate acyltransferase [Thioalkalivibrio sp. XN279]